MVRFAGLFAVIALTVLVAAGCGSATRQGAVTKPSGKFPIVVAHPNVQFKGIPGDVRSRLRKSGAVLLSPSRVAFMSSATVSCAWLPARLTVLDPSTIRIDMRVNGRVSTCGSGAVGFPIAVKIDPTAVDVYKPVTVRLAYRVRLPGGGGISRRSQTLVAPALQG